MGGIAVVLFFGAAQVLAQPAADAGSSEEPELTAPRRAADEDPEIRVSGRVFARGSTGEREQWARDLSVPSARAQVEARFGIARAVIEADIASTNLVKDAYVRLEPADGWRVYAGQFKAPFLARSLESRWRLPLISRGMVDDYLTDKQQLGGRRLGLMGEARLDGLRRLELQLGAFQGARDEVGRRLGEDLSARVALEPVRKRLEVGASSYFGDPLGGGLSRFAAGADLAFDVGGFRLGAEALGGRLPAGRFAAELLYAAWRIPVGQSGDWAVEPLAAAESLQVFADTTGVGGGVLGGVNFHYGERLRLQTQLGRALGPGDTTAATRIDVQLGARF
jgi:hypothetical protein